MRDYNPNMPPIQHNWDAFVAAHPGGHLLQTPAWGTLKGEFGWRAEITQIDAKDKPKGDLGRLGDGGALVLFRPLPLGFTLAYVPRGPVADWGDESMLRTLIAKIGRVGRQQRAICLKVEPDLPNEPANRELLLRLGFRPSPHVVQPPRSLIIDLSPDEAAILGRMKPKTRYNIGLASKRGVTARVGSGRADLDAFTDLMAATGSRDGFGVHAPEYYRRAHALFAGEGRCALVLAEFEGKALAGVMAFALGERAWYFFGASADELRQHMAPYLAQWEAMRWAKGRGALSYDLWGVPDTDEAALEAGFEQRRDGLWGVYRFKRGWGGRLIRTVGTWDKVYDPVMYQAYLAMLKLRQRAPAYA
jgi:lipid II:glycine glycyltransferase (peptidoglycan interpeptide bridge formation enzyme)